MRTAEEHPSNHTEQVIYDTLVVAGYKPEEIQFRGGPNHSHGGRRYLRYGYWQRIDAKVLANLSQVIVEDDIDDDDCGTLFLYPLKDAA